MICRREMARFQEEIDQTLKSLKSMSGSWVSQSSLMLAGFFVFFKWIIKYFFHQNYVCSIDLHHCKVVLLLSLSLALALWLSHSPPSLLQLWFLWLSNSKPRHKGDSIQMKGHIEQDYFVGYIPPLFNQNTYHFPERATIPATPFSNLDPGQMAWSPSHPIPTVAPLTSVTHRRTVCAERAPQDTCLQLCEEPLSFWGELPRQGQWTLWKRCSSSKHSNLHLRATRHAPPLWFTRGSEGLFVGCFAWSTRNV